jgi:hypothetical protein
MIELKYWHGLSFKFLIFGMVQYIILTSIAMIFYSGGTLADPLNQGYHFWGNLFSDLGRIIAISGEPNTISFILFTITALIFAFSFIPFLLALPKFFTGGNLRYKLILIGTGFGLLSIASLLGTILTPWDRFHNLHLMFSNLFNIMGSLVVLFYAVAILYNEDYPNLYAYIYVIILIFGVVYTFTLLLLPKVVSVEVITVQATMQKISQYSFISCFIIQGYGALSLEKIKSKY